MAQVKDCWFLRGQLDKLGRHDFLRLSFDDASVAIFAKTFGISSFLFLRQCQDLQLPSLVKLARWLNFWGLLLGIICQQKFFSVNLYWKITWKATSFENFFLKGNVLSVYQRFYIDAISGRVGKSLMKA